ncbi:SanA/YdcF family protein [Myroides sp. LJL116]
MKCSKHIKKRIFQTLRFLIISFTVLFLSIWLANFYVTYNAFDYIYDDVDKIPSNKVGLVLGTSKKLSNGMDNPYFTKRIAAAYELFKHQKIQYILVSGDNSVSNYNEPLDMKNDLVALGVPQENIFLDYAGFRTLDSVYRTNAIFDQSSFTIISQEFHNQRAVYIAKYLGLNAIGYNAKDVNSSFGYKTILREKLAKVKVLLDQFFGKKPKFLGEKIIIP